MSSRLEISSFHQESSVGNEVPDEEIQFPENHSAEIAIEETVNDGVAVIIHQRSDTTPDLLGENRSAEIAVEETVRNHVNDGGAVTIQRSDTTSDLLGGRLFMLCDVIVPASIMVVIVGLFLIPTIYYALPESTVEMERRTTVSTRNCTQVSEYSGEVCRDELMSLQMCFSGGTSTALNIPTSVDQQTGESISMILVNGLPLLKPSQQCSEDIVPYICLYTFSLCDSSNTLHNILRQDCLDLRDDVCAREWSQAVALLGDGVLPVCEDLPDIIEDCTSNSNNISDINGQIIPSPGNQSSTLECSEGFFFDENGTELCRPTCGEFNPTPLSAEVVKDVGVCISFAASVIMITMALTVQRDSLLVFPSILFAYMCVTTFIISGIVIVGFVAYTALFCKSRDLIESTGKGNETPFCTISGFGFTYGLGQVCMWAVLHTVFLFWAVVFPFNYRLFKLSERKRHAHIISVVLAVVVPLPAGLAHLKDGYTINIVPTLTCTSRNGDFTYYTLVLPVSIITCVTSCLLVVIIWTIFKEFTLKKLLALKKVDNVGKAEIKITAVVIYYTILGVMGLANITYFSSYNYDPVLEYIVCHSGGRESCQSELRTLNEILLMTAGILMLSFLPVVVILFTCELQAFKTKYKTVRIFFSKL